MNGNNSGKEGFSARYTEFLEHFRLTPNSLAKELGDSSKVKYYNWQQGLGEPNSDSLRQIALKFPVSIDWLVLGVGSMVRGESTKLASDDKSLVEENQKLRNELEKYQAENGEMKNEIREYAKDFRKLTVNFTKASSQSPQYDQYQNRIPAKTQRRAGYFQQKDDQPVDRFHPGVRYSFLAPVSNLYRLRIR